MPPSYLARARSRSRREVRNPQRFLWLKVTLLAVLAVAAGYLVLLALRGS
jgi:hypothetical protein